MTTARPCTSCLAQRVEAPFVDPLTRREYSARVEHLPGCRVYREQSFDRAEDVAHLQALTLELAPESAP